jgi:hypothetical protein
LWSQPRTFLLLLPITYRINNMCLVIINQLHKRSCPLANHFGTYVEAVREENFHHHPPPFPSCPYLPHQCHQ